MRQLPPGQAMDSNLPPPAVPLPARCPPAVPPPRRPAFRRAAACPLPAIAAIAKLFAWPVPFTRNPYFMETRADLRVDGTTRMPFLGYCGHEEGVAGGIAVCHQGSTWENVVGGLLGDGKSTRNPALVWRKSGKSRSDGPIHPQPASRSSRWGETRKCRPSATGCGPAGGVERTVLANTVLSTARDGPRWRATALLHPRNPARRRRACRWPGALSSRRRGARGARCRRPWSRLPRWGWWPG